MKKGLLAVLLCLAVLASLPGARHGKGEGVTRCLLVGCDRFLSMPSTEPASTNNTEAMEELLAAFLPGEAAIRRQVNGPGTAAGFEDLVRETFRDAKEGDTSVLYLSTHGVLRQEEGPARMWLLLSDGTTEEPLPPEKLRETLDKVPGKKILILDACHSGAMIGQREGVNYFEGGDYRVLVSCGAEEDSWFWSAEEDAYTGTGYFTAALENALRASDPEQIDPDGNGTVSLKELTARLREIHGASTVFCSPEDDGEPLFRLPEDRAAGSRLQGLSFGPVEADGDALVLPIHFTAPEAVRLMYQLVPSRDGRWDFEHAVKLPDREKTGLIRGLLSPGEKDRKIRLTVKSLGEEGKALMQIISLRGDALTPAAEAGVVIFLPDESWTSDGI